MLVTGDDKYIIDWIKELAKVYELEPKRIYTLNGIY